MAKQSIETDLHKDEGRKVKDDDFDAQFPLLKGAVVKNIGDGTRAWANVVAQNRDQASGAPLQYIEPNTDVGKKVVEIADEEVLDEINKWKKALIVYVLGAKPPFHVMQRNVKRRWNQYGSIKIYLLKTGVFVMEFADEAAIVSAMEGESWTFENKPMILKPWSIDVNLEKEDMITVPIWVRFPNLKLHLWFTNVISKLANVIGKPLFTDIMTTQKEHNCGGVLPEMVSWRDARGRCMDEKIEYEWVPMSCKSCGVFGHTNDRCLKNQNQVVRQEWVVKDNRQKETAIIEDIMQQNAKENANANANASETTTHGRNYSRATPDCSPPQVIYNSWLRPCNYQYTGRGLKHLGLANWGESENLNGSNGASGSRPNSVLRQTKEID
ncbi:hypothetical protein LguiB_032354 [Lonicera macranthoides]